MYAPNKINSVSECYEAIEAIKKTADNYPVADKKRFLDGVHCNMLKGAQKMIERLEARADKLCPNEKLESLVRAYLRASTNEQDATRAKGELKEFAKKHNKRIAHYYVENESGAKLERPELMTLIADSEAGDIILVEHIDRLSRLNKDDWDVLKDQIKLKGLKLVIVNLAMTHDLMGDDETKVSWMMQAVNEMVIEVGASMARADYELRRKRQAEGIEKAKSEGKYKGGKGRAINKNLHRSIAGMVAKGMNNTEVAKELGCSTKTVQRFKKDHNL